MPARYLLLAVILSTFSFSKEGFKDPPPPGTVRINDTLFADYTEIGNIHWREYLQFLSETNEGDDIITKELPDTAVWGNAIPYNEFRENYFRHPGYNNYPVVGISYQQAVNFCKWRTFVVNFADYLKKNKFTDYSKHLRDSFPIKIIYRLPTEKEWEMIASGKLSVDKYPYGVDSIYRKWKRVYRPVFNCNYPGESKRNNTTDLKSYYPNSYGCYNMIGNVSEMVAETGIAKGGSYLHLLGSCEILMKQLYTKPEKWLGFRCVAVRKK